MELTGSDSVSMPYAEQVWLENRTNPNLLLGFLSGCNRLSDRKLRLFAKACEALWRKELVPTDKLLCLAFGRHEASHDWSFDPPDNASDLALKALEIHDEKPN